MPKKRIREGQRTRDNSTQYVFLDTQIVRNLQDERKVSCEFHKMMRSKKFLEENFESRFVKTLKDSKRNKFEQLDSNLSMIVDVDTSECPSNNTFDLTPGTSYGHIGSKVNFDSWSETYTSKTYVEEYISYNSYEKRYMSQSYDSIFLDRAKKKKRIRNKGDSVSNKGKSIDNIDMYSHRKKGGLITKPLQRSMIDDSYESFNNKTYKGTTNDAIDDQKTNLILVDNVNQVKTNGNSIRRHNIVSILHRMAKFVERIVGWKCTSQANTIHTDATIKVDQIADDLSKVDSSNTERVTTVYQVSATQDGNYIEKSTISSSSKMFEEKEANHKTTRSPFRNIYANSLSLPLRKWFTLSSRSAHSTGDLWVRPKRHPIVTNLELPDKGRLIDISRGYYPLTKWALLNRMFRQKILSENIAKATAKGQGDQLAEIVNGSVKENSREDGSKSDVKPVSLSEVKVEDGVKSTEEKRSQDDDEDECGSGWGYWIEYLLVLLVSVILLLGCVFLVLFWCFYYKKGYNSWKVERDQQFNLHPTLMVGAVVFTGFSVLMYRIGRCSRRLYVKLLHATFHLLAILCFVGGFLSIFEWHNMINLTHFYSLHSWIGFITMGLFGVQFLVGFVSFLVLLCCESATAGFRACLLPLHTTFGLAIFLISIATCLTGLVQRTNSTIGEENYPSLPEEAIVVNALGVALVAVGVAVTYALGRTSLRVKSDCYISERL